MFLVANSAFREVEMKGSAGTGLVALLVVAMALVIGCSTGPSGSVDKEGSGQVQFDLKIDRTAHINKLNYTVSGPHGVSISGSFDRRSGRPGRSATERRAQPRRRTAAPVDATREQKAG
jgi:hypothetical protein